MFSKWNYHHSLVHKGQLAQEYVSEFRRATNPPPEDPQKKPTIRFKIGPPPPKTKPEPPPPTPPPRRRDSPKLKLPKRKVEVDVFSICWRESWMSLKPPKVPVPESPGGPEADPGVHHHPGDQEQEVQRRRL
ncbi:neural Wiskott-Aldrich syndrome protein-like [Sphaeramia orbicularis]|uniref:neural Wiskott-Aldrich syndrome protein-like n=1 Tax=Sphaeramia orbicularis TaxID=375764 RepID=UPI00117C78D0|nr:neural Wiskott-Aldrich syndrome protein-like [Sphaeramia orbicularis]